MKSIQSLLALLLFVLSINAQSISPKEEFRGVWIATVFNSDFPKKPIPLKVAHQEQYRNLLDRLKKLGMNAVIVQVRAAGDAFYPSDLAPWSAFLTGKQGMPPTPDYDILEFMVEEAHKRSMEFHAWFNPYRATMNLDTTSLASNHAFRRNRSWMVEYGGKFYFNPGLEAVRQHLIQVVMEVVNKYDIDAVHFDDYFYPYRSKDGAIFPDTTQFQAAKGRFKEIGDWRRSNVDVFVEQLSSAIKSSKPHVKFGISPFGVWRNIEDDKRGSNTKASVRSYDDLHADVIKWLRMGWIDYVIPQLYWNIGFAPADHESLVKWWSANAAGKHLYIGHAAYKVGDNNELTWDDPKEIPRQINLNRKNFYTIGSAYFRAKSVLRNRLGVRDSIDRYYSKPALIPVMEELSGKRPKAPKLANVKKKSGHPKLIWKANKDDVSKGELPAYYAVYRFKNDKPGSVQEGNQIIYVTPFHEGKKRLKFVDRSTDAEEFYTYVVTALNRLHYESPTSNSKTIFKGEKGISRVKD